MEVAARVHPAVGRLWTPGAGQGLPVERAVCEQLASQLVELTARDPATREALSAWLHSGPGAGPTPATALGAALGGSTTSSGVPASSASTASHRSGAGPPVSGPWPPTPASGPSAAASASAPWQPTSVSGPSATASASASVPTPPWPASVPSASGGPSRGWGSACSAFPPGSPGPAPASPAAAPAPSAWPSGLPVSASVSPGSGVVVPSVSACGFPSSDRGVVPGVSAFASPGPAPASPAAAPAPSAWPPGLPASASPASSVVPLASAPAAAPSALPSVLPVSASPDSGVVPSACASPPSDSGAVPSASASPPPDSAPVPLASAPPPSAPPPSAPPPPEPPPSEPPPTTPGPAPGSAPTTNLISGSPVFHGPSVQARDIHGGVHFHHATPAPPPPHPVPRQLPPVTARFVGREADRRALDVLWAERSAHAAQVLVVSGLAGVGKTTLAAHWLHEHADSFPDGQLYADLGGRSTLADGAPVSPATVLEAFLVALGASSVPKRDRAAERAVAFHDLGAAAGRPAGQRVHSRPGTPPPARHCDRTHHGDQQEQPHRAACRRRVRAPAGRAPHRLGRRTPRRRRWNARRPGTLRRA
ncbi:ATP-binding protein [Streptomyces sp. SAI-090]|uniref:ATP-binding protein n=1 Tax=Streptomyces sp. SAI-090 TaxID=2940545 RepID=UPI0032AF84E6